MYRDIKFAQVIEYHIGPFGFWQQLLLLGSALTYLPAILYLPTFPNYVPDFRCRVPACETDPADYAALSFIVPGNGSVGDDVNVDLAVRKVGREMRPDHGLRLVARLGRRRVHGRRRRHNSPPSLVIGVTPSPRILEDIREENFVSLKTSVGRGSIDVIFSRIFCTIQYKL